MSRHQLVPLAHTAALAPIVEITIGWDPGLATYFLQVMKRQSDDDDAEDHVWIGADRHAEVPDVDTILGHARDHAAIAPGLRAVLLADREKQGARARHPWVQ